MKRKAWVVAACLAAGLAACGSDSTPKSGGSGGGDDGRVAALEVEPSRLVVGVAEERQIVVRAFDDEGAELDVSVYYVSTDPEIALVSDQGVVAGRAKGQTLVEVQAGRQRATVAVTVEGKAWLLRIPDEIELGVGSSLPLEIVAQDIEGDDLDRSRITWSSEDPEVAVVEHGTLFAKSWGETTIRATIGELEETIQVRSLLRFEELGVGEGHTCGRTPTKRVYCWGSAEEGELGFDADDAIIFLPSEPVGEGRRFEALAVGARHACALDEEGWVSCWGQNDEDQLGSHRIAHSSKPVDILDVPPLRSIRAQGGQTCGLTEDGDAHCWGGRLSMVEATEGRSFVELAVGARHVCGLDEAGHAYCWGANDRGQLGQTTEELASSEEPVMVQGIPILEAIGAGRDHVCGIASSNRRLHCWGSNERGELGRGFTSEAEPPDITTTNFPYVSLGLGKEASCAVTQSAGPYCWGANDFGQSGTGLEDETLTTPERVTSGTWSFVRIWTGFQHSCALSERGEAYCWGSGSRGQLGAPGCGSEDGCSTPQLVAGQR